jgi:hypothetical protein
VTSTLHSSPLEPGLGRVRFDLAAGNVGCEGLALTDRRAGVRLIDVLDLATGTTVATAEVTLVAHELLARAGLTVLRYPRVGPTSCCPPVVPPALRRFRHALAETDRDLLGRAVDWCRDFLGARRHGEQRLSAHPQVAYQFAGLVARAAVLRQVDLPATLDDPAGRAWWVREVDELAHGLIRMAGGRSVLSGQMVQLRTALLYANRVYLGGSPCLH